MTRTAIPQVTAMVDITPGSRFQSTVCSTEVIIVKGSGAVELMCGGAAMVEVGSESRSGSPAPDAASGTQLGKRYTDQAETVEVLCTKAGDGSLVLDGEPMAVKEAKPLPASD